MPSSNEKLIDFGQEFKNIYLIKKGTINLFDPTYTYLCSLEETSFFGDYQVILGVASDIQYRVKADIFKTIIYKIDAEVFLQAICEDELVFKHYFKMAL